MEFNLRRILVVKEQSNTKGSMSNAKFKVELLDIFTLYFLYECTYAGFLNVSSMPVLRIYFFKEEAVNLFPD